MANKIRQWLDKATIPERNKLVRGAGTTLGALRQKAGGYRNGGRVSMSPRLARRVELAAKKIHREGLPELKRAELCADCGACEFAKGK